MSVQEVAGAKFLGVYKVVDKNHRPRITLPAMAYRDMGEPDDVIAIYYPDLKALVVMPVNTATLEEFVVKVKDRLTRIA